MDKALFEQIQALLAQARKKHAFNRESAKEALKEMVSDAVLEGPTGTVALLSELCVSLSILLLTLKPEGKEKYFDMIRKMNKEAEDSFTAFRLATELPPVSDETIPEDTPPLILDSKGRQRGIF